MNNHIAAVLCMLAFVAHTDDEFAKHKSVPSNLPQPPYILPHPGDGGCTFPGVQKPPVPCNGPLEPPAPPPGPVIEFEPQAVPDHSGGGS